jgi:hypothetical protein
MAGSDRIDRARKGLADKKNRAQAQKNHDRQLLTPIFSGKLQKSGVHLRLTTLIICLKLCNFHFTLLYAAQIHSNHMSFACCRYPFG